MIGGGLLWRVAHDDPAAVVVILALNMEGVTGKARPYQVEVRDDRRRQGSPFLPGWIAANRLRLERPGIEYGAGDIGAFALKQHTLFAGRPVDPEQCRFVL